MSEIDHFSKYNIPSFSLIDTYGFLWYKPSTWRDDFRMYNPVNPQKHSQIGADALLLWEFMLKNLTNKSLNKKPTS